MNSNKLLDLSVFILNGNFQYREMWAGFGAKIVDNPAKADIIQFTGGEDVSPELYGEGKHPTTGNNVLRDEREKQVFDQYVGQAFLAGICRGGQFLNVMCGGSMIQDCDNHALAKGHGVTDHETGKVVYVTSTHHQMMVPGSDAYVVATVPHTRCTYKEGAMKHGEVYSHDVYEPDMEVILYPHLRTLCFQPHPEYSNLECRAYYKELLERYL